ncbi:MAG: hypothetical protein M1549_03265 [Candidatus Dependentiae bacterium]|nr:hypothetical protein [Candidatus Dependentiae bacterium]
MRIPIAYLAGAIFISALFAAQSASGMRIRPMESRTSLLFSEVWRTTKVQKSKKGILHLKKVFKKRVARLSNAGLAAWTMQDILSLTTVVVGMLGKVGAHDQGRIRRALQYLKYSIKYRDDQLLLSALRAHGYTRAPRLHRNETVCRGTSATLRELSRGWSLCANKKAIFIKKGLATLVTVADG